MVGVFDRGLLDTHVTEVIIWAAVTFVPQPDDGAVATVADGWVTEASTHGWGCHKPEVRSEQLRENWPLQDVVSVVAVTTRQLESNDNL